MKIKAKNVAKYFYNKNNDLTEKQLQKLTYYAYAWYLTIYNERLFEESPQAWLHGPVFMSLYKDIQNDKLIETDTECIKNDAKIKKILEIIYKIYGKYSGYKLELLTHSEDPWKNARKGLSPTEKSRNIISDEDIKAYYA
jgi:uncharacterized phage-associated protein